MDDVTLARALHVLAVVIWIGGVSMVTTVLLPAVKRMKSPEERIAFFESVERRFAAQARVTVTIAGATGFYLACRLDLWEPLKRFQMGWVHAMFAVWLVFSFMLFIAEPLFLHAWFARRAASAPEATFQLVQRLHWILLSISALAILAGVLGSHGFSYF